MTVMVKVPRGALLPTVIVNVLVEVGGSGLNAAVTPLGKPEADRFTLSLNPFDGAIVIVLPRSNHAKWPRNLETPTR